MKFERALWILTILISGVAWAQEIPAQPKDSAALQHIRRILIAGNHKTQDRIILRELSLNAGDTVRRYQIKKLTADDRKRLYNLRLFNDVQVLVIEEGDEVDLVVVVEERWFTYPVPIFELSDRNFNEWWQNYGHDFSRVNYGLRLFQYNFRGRNETLRLTARYGFSKRFDLSYRIPNLTRNQKHGLLLEFIYAEPSNLAYRTTDHVLTFLNDRKPLRRYTESGLTYTFRKSFYQTHSLRLGVESMAISDTIFTLNRLYLNGRKSQWYSSLSYRFIAEHRDVIAYPLRGYQVTAGLTRAGLGLGDQVNQWNVSGSLAIHKPWRNELYFSWFTMFQLATADDQPYTALQGLGYRRQFLRGYEIYVLEGPFFTMQKATLKKRLFDREFHTGIGYPQFRKIPLAVYLKAYADVGFVKNYPSYEKAGFNTRLSDKPLAGFGVGLDLVGYYDSVIRLEYTLTNQLTRGFYLNIRKEF